MGPVLWTKSAVKAILIVSLAFCACHDPADECGSLVRLAGDHRQEWRSPHIVSLLQKVETGDVTCLNYEPIPADLIAWLLIDPKASECLTTRGIRIYNAVVE